VAQYLARIVFTSGSVREERATAAQIDDLFGRDLAEPRLISYILGADAETGHTVACWHHAGETPPFSSQELAPCVFKPSNAR
jgi:hypothetical protein